MINSHFNSCINNHWICPRTHWRYIPIVPHSFSKCWVNIMYPLHVTWVRSVSYPCTYPQPHQELIVLAQNTSPSPTPRVLILHFSLVPPPFYLIFARLRTGLQASTILPEWLFFLKGESVTMPHHSFINLSVDSYWWHMKNSPPEQGPKSPPSLGLSVAPAIIPIPAPVAFWLSLPLGLCTH